MKTLDEYLALTYPIELIADTDQGGYFAQHPALPGCMAQGETADEAVASLNEARRDWIEARMAAKLPIPEPAATQPSGKFLLRMPTWMHAELTSLAERQGTSLNQLIVSFLASSVGTQSKATQMDELLTEIRNIRDTLRTQVTTSVLSHKPKTLHLGKGLSRSLAQTRTVIHEKDLQGSGVWYQTLSDAPAETERETQIDMTDLVIAAQQSRR